MCLTSVSHFTQTKHRRSCRVGSSPVFTLQVEENNVSLLKWRVAVLAGLIRGLAYLQAWTYCVNINIA